MTVNRLGSGSARWRRRAIGSALAGLAIIGTAASASGAARHSSSKQTVVTIWSWFVQPTMDKAIKGFEATHPNIKVEYSYYNYSPQYLAALQAAVKSNTLPDIIGLNPAAQTAQYRPYLVPLNSLAAKTWGKDWTKNVYPIDLKQMLMGNPKGNKNYYLMPQESKVEGMYYNVKLFQKYHLTVPTTLTQLASDASVLTKAGYIGFYQGTAGLWQDENVFVELVDQIKPDAFQLVQQGKLSWTSPTFVEALTSWQKLFKNNVVQSGSLSAQTYPTGAELFAAGRVGMVFLGSFWLQEPQLPGATPLVKGMQGFDWFKFPAQSASTKPGPIIGGIDLGDGLTKNGAKNPAAWEFLSSLVDGAGAKAASVDLNDLPAFNNLPAPKLAPRIISQWNAFKKVLPTAENERFYSPVVETAADNALTGVASGQLTVTAALGQIAAAQKKVGSAS